MKQQYVLIHWRDATMNDHNQCSRQEAEQSYDLIDGVIEEIMEWLEDNDYLSDKGRLFKTQFWKLFIRQTK